MNPEAFQAVAYAASQERSLEVVLKRIVEGLVGQLNVALARVWLVAPGDICSHCRLRSVCPDQTRCLHLVASDGRPRNRAEDWTRINGDFRRIPIGREIVGNLCPAGEPLLIELIGESDRSIERPDWARRERIRSFAGYPLVFRGEPLGAMAVFSRAAIDGTDFGWFSTFAGAAAVSIANARAFDEIDQLRQRLESQNDYLRSALEEASNHPAIIGRSTPLRRMLEQIELVAPTDATVLITGETGVGKELVARAIHQGSARHNRPLIKVNCSAIPRELFESEFFGHIKGAFSGASNDRLGRFQLADAGTLFLDEIGDLPPAMQPKLLRALQEGEFESVGDDRTRRANVRIVAATNHDLLREVHRGRFRQDLFYRLSVFPIRVPSLRERKDDIPLLAEQFVESACRRFKRTQLQLTEENLHQLEAYGWPGNIRELQNVIERAVITARLGMLRFDLPIPSEAPAGRIELHSPTETEPAVVKEHEMRQHERDNIMAALRQSQGRIYGAGGAAELLGLRPTTLSARIKKFGLKKVIHRG